MFGVKLGESNWSVWTAVIIAGLFLSGCSSVSLNRAPVEDRGNAPKPAVVVTDTTPAPIVKLPPGAENAGKPGYYTVKPKDTLIAIGLENGASHKDIARWNNLENPNKIEIGQVLRVVPPVIEGTSAVAKPVTSGAVVATTVAPGAPAKPASAPAANSSAPGSVPAASASSDDDLGWIWPSGGTLIAGLTKARPRVLTLVVPVATPWWLQPMAASFGPPPVRALCATMAT